MPSSVEQTRRDFLLRLAKTAAFVPPAIASFDVRPAAAQGKGSTQAQSTSSSSTVGTLSPTAQTMPSSDFRLSTQAETQPSATAPWSPSSPSQPPPWSRPPPTQTGR